MAGDHRDWNRVAMDQETKMSERTEKRLLAVILGLFVLLSATYSVVVPPFEASDELWHYPMVKYIADHWSLPVQDPANVGPWRQEGSQPPLYYFLGALATFWIDTSDMAQVRHLNPHVDNGVATPDGNINLVVHHPAREAFPWRGTVLAVHLVRFLSVLMGAAAVTLTYLIVREVLPDEPALALGAAAIHAFTPMYVFISGSVNNDNLVIPLSSLALLMLLKKINFQPQFSVVRPWSLVISYLPLGFVLGLATLAKTNAVLLTLLTALVVTVRAVRRRSWLEFLVGGLATLIPFLLIVGWWCLRNLQLYGDLTGFNMFLTILGTRDVPADVAQMWRERYSFAAGYWGNFGGLNVPMASWVYAVLNALVIVAALGLVLTLLRITLPFLAPSFFPIVTTATTRRRFSLSSLLLVSLSSLLLCLLWGLGIFLSWLLWWSRITWSSQGRLVFPAISVWSLLLALGLAGWLPSRWRRWVVAAYALFLLGLSTAAPFVWIQPAYALPEPLTAAQVDAISHRVEADFGGVMRLLGYDLETENVEPGGQVGITLYWEALTPTGRDHTVFVHILGEHDRTVAQRDTFPGLGLLSTTWLEPGNAWADRYVVPVDANAYTPDEAQVEVGLYDTLSEVRLITNNDNDNVRFGRVNIRSRPGQVPNPISVNFGDRMELVGYELSELATRPGETITLTLHWRGLRAMETNYTISAQLVDKTQRKAAQRDGWPLDGDAPTAAWKPGQKIAEARSLTIFPDTPPGIYDVRIAVYALEEEKIVHLSVISEGGQMLSNYIALTRVRVTP
jgi:4-amino-4-deoxy-L-arabinose transferase-like glycosyltransferase